MFSTQCILCDSGLTEKLIKASTADIDVTFRTFATKTDSSQLLASLATASNMHAKFPKSSCSENPLMSCEAVALTELVAYINESQGQIFKLKELNNMYEGRLKKLGCIHTTGSNSARLKERLLKESQSYLQLLK